MDLLLLRLSPKQQAVLTNDVKASSVWASFSSSRFSLLACGFEVNWVQSMRLACQCICRINDGPFLGGINSGSRHWRTRGALASRRVRQRNVNRGFRAAALVEGANLVVPATPGEKHQPKSLPDVPSRSSEIAPKASVFNGGLLLGTSDKNDTVYTQNRTRIDVLGEARNNAHLTTQDRLLNSLLRGKITLEGYKAAVEIFDRYVSDQDPIPHYTVIHKYFWCLCELRLAERLESSLAYFTHRGFVPSAYTYNILIRVYLNRLELRNAISVLSRMGQTRPNIQTINLLLRGQLLARSTLDDINSTTTIMNQLKLRPNITTYNTLVAIYYNMDMPALASSVLEAMCVPQNTTTFNTIICHHLYCEEFTKAFAVLLEMHKKNVRRTAHTYALFYKSALPSTIGNDIPKVDLLNKVEKMRIADSIPLNRSVNNEALRIHTQQHGLASAKVFIREMDLRGKHLGRSSFNLLSSQSLNKKAKSAGSMWHDKTMLKHAALYNAPSLWHSAEFRRIQIEPEGQFNGIWKQITANTKVGDVKSCVDQIHNLINQRISPPLWLFSRVIALALRSDRHDLAEGLVLFVKHTKAIGLIPSLMLSLLVSKDDAEVFEITRTLIDILHGNEFRIPGKHVYQSIVTVCASALYRHKLRHDAYKLIRTEFKDEDIPKLDSKALTIAFEIWYSQIDLYRIGLGLTALREVPHLVPTKRIYRVLCRGKNNYNIRASDKEMFERARQEIVHLYLSRANGQHRRRKVSSAG